MFLNAFIKNLQATFHLLQWAWDWPGLQYIWDWSNAPVNSFLWGFTGDLWLGWFKVAARCFRYVFFVCMWDHMRIGHQNDADVLTLDDLSHQTQNEFWSLCFQWSTLGLSLMCELVCLLLLTHVPLLAYSTWSWQRWAKCPLAWVSPSISTWVVTPYLCRFYTTYQNFRHVFMSYMRLEGLCFVTPLDFPIHLLFLPPINMVTLCSLRLVTGMYIPFMNKSAPFSAPMDSCLSSL